MWVKKNALNIRFEALMCDSWCDTGLYMDHCFLHILSSGQQNRHCSSDPALDMLLQPYHNSIFYMIYCLHLMYFEPSSKRFVYMLQTHTTPGPSNTAVSVFKPGSVMAITQYAV